MHNDTVEVDQILEMLVSHSVKRDDGLLAIDATLKELLQKGMSWEVSYLSDLAKKRLARCVKG